MEIKIDYETNVKNALVVTLLSGLKKPATLWGIYTQARSFLEKYTGERYSNKDIDKLSRDILLKDSKLVEMLRRHKSVKDTPNLVKFSYSSIYRILNELYKSELEVRGIKKQLKVVPKSKNNETGVVMQRRFLRPTPPGMVGRRTKRLERGH